LKLLKGKHLQPVAFSIWRVSGWSELYPCGRLSLCGDSRGDKIVCSDRHMHCYRWKDQHGFRPVQKAWQEVVSMGQPVGMLSIVGSMPGFGLRLDSVDLPVMSSWVGARLYQVPHGACCGWDPCSSWMSSRVLHRSDVDEMVPSDPSCNTDQGV